MTLHIMYISNHPLPRVLRTTPITHISTSRPIPRMSRIAHRTTHISRSTHHVSGFSCCCHQSCKILLFIRLYNIYNGFIAKSFKGQSTALISCSALEVRQLLPLQLNRVSMQEPKNRVKIFPRTKKHASSNNKFRRKRKERQTFFSLFKCANH